MKPNDIAANIILKQIRFILIIFIVGLVFSGLTAFPIEWQLSLAHQWIQTFQWDNSFTQWIELVYKGIHETNTNYPFISYGTDWLAFAHLVIAVAFIGPYKDPVKNIWVIEFGIIACLCIFPFALIVGAVRGIPLYWRLIDCSFGIVGGLLLWSCHSKIKKMKIKLG